MRLFLRQMLSASGVVSCMRVMSMVSLFAGIGVAFYGLHDGVEPTGLSMLAGVFVAAAFGGKVAQSKYEPVMKAGSVPGDVVKCDDGKKVVL